LICCSYIAASIFERDFVYPLVVEAEMIEFHNSTEPLAIIINPVPPTAIPDGIDVICDTIYGNIATMPKNGAPNQLTRFKTLVI
jgi:hypothetical protein